MPEKWTRLDVIPLNPNGKVDKIKLKASAVELCEVVEKINVTAKAHVKHDSVVDAGKATTEVVLPLSAKIQDTLPPSPAISQDADVEEGLNKKMGSMSTNRSSIQEPIPALVPGQLPHPKHSPWQTWLRYRVFIAYRWLLLMIILVNCGIAAWLLHKHIEGDGFPLSATATATAANLTAAVLIRSEPVINLLFTIFSSVPRWMPLIIRRACAQIYHLGGVHSGCAIASLIWFLAFTVGASLELGKHVRRLSLTPIILSYIITSLLLTMSLLSCPGLRAKYHNLWEKVHRFGGWTILLLYWILVGFTTRDLNVGSPMPLSEALARNPSIWLISVATAAIIFPWLFLRRVPVSSEVLSSHAIRLHFKYTDLSPGFGVRLAEHPMGDWHGFATITNADKSDTATKGNGFSVIVSRAGDFTGRTIDTAPKFIWKRGIPTCGVLRIASLFKSVVIVATGSGIGPCLSVFKFDVKMRILWTAPNHEATFGSLIVDDVRKRDPQAVIHNTRTQGKPDMALMTHKLYKESGAEAVLVISNKRLTTQIVYEMERRGIPAYGAIFDS